MREAQQHTHTTKKLDHARDILLLVFREPVPPSRPKSRDMLETRTKGPERDRQGRPSGIGNSEGARVPEVSDQHARDTVSTLVPGGVTPMHARRLEPVAATSRSSRYPTPPRASARTAPSAPREDRPGSTEAPAGWEWAEGRAKAAG